MASIIKEYMQDYRMNVPSYRQKSDDVCVPIIRRKGTFMFNFRNIESDSKNLGILDNICNYKLSCYDVWGLPAIYVFSSGKQSLKGFK
jgi:hypothetical protein